VTLHAPLQVIVDALAADIQRDVAIDDRHIRWLAHSPHRGAPDEARMRSILARRVTDAAAAWAFSFGIHEAEGPVRLPANTTVGAQPRICVALRHSSILLGFMFIIDPDESLTSAQLEQAEHAAHEAAQVLYRERRLRELERERQRWLITHLLGPEPAEAEDAARALVEEAVLEAGRAVVLVLHAEASADDRPRVEIGLGAALDRLGRLVPDRGGVGMCRADHGVFVAAADAPGARSPRDLAERLAVLGDEELSAVGQSVQTRVGVGATHALGEARRSYGQALDAAAVARRIERFGRVAAWDTLGVYRTLASFPEGLGDDALHPGVIALLDGNGNDDLILTLEVYLDHAGDAKAAAEALCVHRASLYHRLQRIEKITGARLKDGDDRLALHLGLRLARLTQRQ